MDELDKLLKQLHNDVATEMKEMTSFNYCPECGEQLEDGCLFCPYCGADLQALQSQLKEQKPSDPTISSPVGSDVPCKVLEPLYALPHYEELHEDTKAKIGTFEKLYKDTYEKETLRELREYASKSYNTLDYAPLVNLLASALEIELYYSVFLMTRKLLGKKVITVEIRKVKWNLDLTKEQTKIMFNDIILCLEKACDNLRKKGLNNPEGCKNLLSYIKSVRNHANHKEYIKKEKFFRFYAKVQQLFNEHLEQLISLKRQVANNESPAPVKKGIIFTDTKRLAQKLSEPKKQDCLPEIQNCLQQYIHKLKTMGVQYELFDCNNEFYTQGKAWQDYSDALNSFCNSTFSSDDQPIALFIVGGNDVIPMPAVLNPMPDLVGEEEKTIESDVLYAYYEKDSSLTDPEGKVSISVMKHKLAKFYIGRLPLEEGEGHLKPDAFMSYFDRALEAHIGINIDSHVPISCESATEVTSSILADLPVFKQDNIKGLVEEDKIISPQMMIPFSEEEMNGPAFQYYSRVLKKADMLTFNLHGSNVPSACGYYGERKDKQIQKETIRTDQPIVFIPQLIMNSSAKIVTSMCCWGARFINYKHEESTLLTAIYDKVLLFMGSCRTAYGMFDIYIKDGVNIMSLSDLLVKYYINYLFQGYDAGLALQKAKSDYLNNPDADFDKVMCAILEFNLFGDPMLFVRQQIDRKPVCQENKALNLVKRSYKIVYKRSKEEDAGRKKSLLEQVRMMVNSNLYEIREIVNKELYENYHVEPRTLALISSYEDTQGNKGYNFVYHETINEIAKNTYVDVDTDGHIQMIYGSK